MLSQCVSAQFQVRIERNLTWLPIIGQLLPISAFIPIGLKRHFVHLHRRLVTHFAEEHTNLYNFLTSKYLQFCDESQEQESKVIASSSNHQIAAQSNLSNTIQVNSNYTTLPTSMSPIAPSLVPTSTPPCHVTPAPTPSSKPLIAPSVAAATPFPVPSAQPHSSQQSLSSNNSSFSGLLPGPTNSSINAQNMPNSYKWIDTYVSYSYAL